jgi:hypothetical protein
MLYSKNCNKELDNSLFKNPTCEYRGAPFWAWNCKLDKRLVETQIEYLKEMGLGGFHMHSRTGMATEYLGTEFMELINACVAKAEKENMLAWLYDEDRWPSGAAGGLVTKDPKYRARKLVFSPNEKTDFVAKEAAIQSGGTYFVACYDILLNENGELAYYKRIETSGKATGDKWYAWCMTNETNPWFNNQTYVDTLGKAAMDKFIEITYEGYKNAIGDKFGGVVPAIFTDEPQFEKKKALNFAKDKAEVILPWTNDLTDTYMDAYGLDLLECLPEMVWELPDGRISKARYLYHDHIAERFAGAFADNCGKWCEDNNLMLTGHMMEEPTLESQSAMLGDAMRSYRSFQLPGIDMLCDHVELTTAKQAQSACHQYGREGVLSELYGVTNWDFDFRGHKFQGDWQAALGVTVRVQHLSWVSMAGEAKRDYPASINYQSPWYKEYPYVEDHFARLNTVLTRGTPVVKVGVIHPVESYWLHMGPWESTSTIREQLDNNFQKITEWLLFGQVDFDFICESTLSGLCPAGLNPLKVGKMEYSTIIVPGCETLRQSTLDRLEQFRKNGGRLVFVGECPKYMDSVLSDKVNKLYQVSEEVPFEHASVLSALENEKIIEIRNDNGRLTDNLIYQMRQDSNCKWLFIAHGVKTIHVDAVKPQKVVIKIKGGYTPVLFDTLTGQITDIDYIIENGNTVIKTDMYCHDSILLRLDEKNVKAKVEKDNVKNMIAQIDFKNKVQFILEEPNVLLLDMAEYAFDGGALNNIEEILRVDNLFRKKLGFPQRQDAVAQPWTLDEDKIEHYITLKFKINSEIEVENAILAIEDAERLVIALNDDAVKSEIMGYYVDESIKSIKLPVLKSGMNILTVKIPFGRTTNLEYCYLLGRFNVKVEGCEKTIVAPTDKIGFSSITSQGMPFYGGNITYRTEIETGNCSLSVKVNNYRGSLVKIIFDGKVAGTIAYAPYKVMIDNVKAGKHKIEYILFGNRYNTFAALHNADTANNWHGPNAWRTTGDGWCYEYKLKEAGILASPVIEILG